MPEIIVIAHNIRSTHNVGSIFRTAEGFGVKKIILSGYTPYPKIEKDARLPHLSEKITNQIHKTALGAEDSMKWRYFEETLPAIHELKAEGYTVFSVEQTENSISLETLHLDRTQKYAVILGHEVHGVQQSVIDASHGCIEIPQYGTKHSLNVSVTAGIVIWDFFKQLSG